MRRDARGRVRLSNATRDARCSCIIGLVVIYGVFALWSWVNGAFQDWDLPPELHHNGTSNSTHFGGGNQTTKLGSCVNLNSTLHNASVVLPPICDDHSSNTTAMKHPSCNGSSWSPGSAFFTIIALTFGYFAHPRGSSVHSSSGRMWRLSPLFALNETMVLLIRIGYAKPWRDGSLSMREISYGLLAIRVGNAWSQREYDEFVTRQAADEVRKVEAGQLSQEETPALGLKSVQTWPRLATEVKETSTAGHKGENPAGPLKAAELAHQRKKLSRAMLKHHLRIVDEFEHGPTIRVFVWVPMLLQVAKLLVVSGAWFAKSIGFIYFFSWLLIEILSIYAAQRPITEGEIRKAMDLGEEYHAPNWQVKGEYFPPIMKTAADRVGSGILFAHGIMNFFSLGKILNFRGFGALLMSFIAFIPFITPVPLILLAMSVSTMWRLMGGEKRFGKFWYSAVIPNWGEADWSAVYPAFMALCSVLLEVFMFAGVGGAAGSFPCWKTRKPDWYDWLG